MKRTIITLLIAILLPVIAGCTRNDGDIGTWFGSWKLERITIDGLIDEKYKGDIFWQFQSSVFCARFSRITNTKSAGEHGRSSATTRCSSTSPTPTTVIPTVKTCTHPGPKPT